MFIGEVLKAGTNLNKGPRKDQEAPNVTVHIYIYMYLLTPWCRVLLEQLTGLQLVKKFPAFHGT